MTEILKLRGNYERIHYVPLENLNQFLLTHSKEEFQHIDEKNKIIKIFNKKNKDNVYSNSSSK